jgi:hypothetical protein
MEDRYSQALKEMMNRPITPEGFSSENNPQTAALTEDMSGAGMGSMKVISMETPMAQAIREMAQKERALSVSHEPTGKLIQVEGGGLEDIRNAQDDFTYRERQTDRGKSKIDNGEFNHLRFDQFMDAKGLDGQDFRTGDVQPNPKDVSEYQKLMKDAASNGLLTKGSWAAEYAAPEAGKEATRVASKNRRELDKIYGTAKEMHSREDTLSPLERDQYDMLKGVVDQLRDRGVRNRWDYALPELNKMDNVYDLKSGQQIKK